MTPTEVAAKLRAFNEWRRGGDIEYPGPLAVGEAIDAAVEMVDRLEAAESDALEQARLNGMGASREAALLAKLEAAEKERDTLRAKIEAMERQEPYAFAVNFPESSRVELVHDLDEAYEGQGDTWTSAPTLQTKP